MLKKRIALVALASIVLSSCGGGAGSSIPVAAPSQPKTGANKSVSISLVLPAAAATPAARAKQFLSPSTQGASINATGAAGGSGSAVVDLSSGSNACSTSGSQRMCKATVVAPVDTDTFVVTLYDTAPSNGAIPSSAHVLGIGTVTQAIGPTFSGSLSIGVAGTVSNIGLNGTYLSVPADGSTHSVGIAIDPTDFGNNPLSSSNAAYSNPINVSLTENGSTGHAQLILNGAKSGTSAKLSSPSDTIAVHYDGGGASGYSDTVTLAATGATSETLTISPLYLSSTSPYFAALKLALSGTASTIPMTATEANAPNTVTYTASPAGCTNIATLSALSGSGASANFSVTGGATASSSGCSIAVTDSTGVSVSFAIINTPVGGTIPLPGASIAEYTINPGTPPASPQALALGPDGSIWISDVSNHDIWTVSTSGAATRHSNGTLSIYPGGLAAGSDGNMYAADQNNFAIDKISGSTGSVLNYWTTSNLPLYIAAGHDGNMWFTEGYNSPTAYIGTYSPGGVLTEYDISSGLGVVASPQPLGIAANPDGSGLWFCVDVNVGTGEIVKVNYSGAMSVIATLTNAGMPDDCTSIAFQSDGKAAWATSLNNDVVYRIDATTHAVVTVPITAPPVQIVAGADNAMYLTSSGAPGQLVERISTVSPYGLSDITVPTGSPTGIALGSDGRLWYGENGQNKVGALTP